MLSWIKSQSPNLYIIIVAIAISIWFEGINIIIAHFFKEKTLKIGIIFCLASIMIFYMDDGNLSELYNPGTSTKAAAAVASKRVEN